MTHPVSPETGAGPAARSSTRPSAPSTWPSARETSADQATSGLAAQQAEGGESVAVHAYTAADTAPLVGGASPLAVIVVLALGVMVLGRLGKRRGGSGKTRRAGSGGGVGTLLVIGLLIGATLTGTALVRSFVHTFVTVLNHIGGLF